MAKTARKRQSKKAMAVKAGISPENLPSGREPSKRVYFRYRRGTKLFRDEFEMMEALENYANACADEGKPFLKTGFCIWLGVSETAIDNYRRDPAYRPVFEMMETLGKHSMLYGGLMEQYNAAMARFILQNHYGYRERTEAAVTDNREPALTVEIVEADTKAIEAKISGETSQATQDTTDDPIVEI